MKVSLSWLRDYVDLAVPVAELVERLTIAGLEVASVRCIGVPVPEGLTAKISEPGPVWDREKIVIGEIIGVEKHPNADKLTLPTVRYGAAESKRLVTGAPNVKLGDSGVKVIVALRGSVLFDGHAAEKKLVELKPAKVRGVESDAMVCSYKELGIVEEHEGIILLDADAPVGTPLADYMGDIVLELDILPNMARCLSMLGVAREVAALTGGSLKLPPHEPKCEGPAIEGQVKVVIEDPKLSARYAAVLLRDVTIKPSPSWLQHRLLYAGMRPINDIVDVTNYVMLEWGQPLHAFDYDVLKQRAGGKAPTIIVRAAREGEVLVTLDKQERKLTPDNLVIADEKGPIALAGVMGGLETEVTDSTKNVLLESANFDFVSIRRTSRALNLPSEASSRFSKGIHPETVRPAALRAAELMRQLGGAKVCAGIVDCYPAPIPARVVELKMSEVRRILGLDVPLKEASRILKALEYGVAEAGTDTLKVTLPNHRIDIQEGAADLIEDIARIYGYDRLPTRLQAPDLPEQAGDADLVVEERIRDLLVNLGLQEVVTYALTHQDREAPLQPPACAYVTLLNPITDERKVMRHTVLAGVLEITRDNLRYTPDVRVFELGYVYLTRDGERFPDEKRRLALVMTGFRQPESWSEPNAARPELDFYDLKGVVESLLAGLHVTDVSYRLGQSRYLHPGQSAEVLVQGTPIGVFGVLHPRVAENKEYKLGLRPVLAGELDLEALLPLVPEKYLYQPISIHPAALRDIALVVDEAITAEQVEREIRAAGGDLLRGLRLFDLYRGESIGAGKKSLAYALTFQSMEATLSDKEIDKIHKRIESRLEHMLKAQIRRKE